MSTKSNKSAVSIQSGNKKGGGKVPTDPPADNAAGSVNSSNGSVKSQGKDGTAKVVQKSKSGISTVDSKIEDGSGVAVEDKYISEKSKEPDDASQITAETGSDIGAEEVTPPPPLQRVLGGIKAILGRYCCSRCLHRSLKVSPEGAQQAAQAAPGRKGKEVPDYVLIRQFEEKVGEPPLHATSYYTYPTICICIYMVYSSIYVTN